MSRGGKQEKNQQFPQTPHTKKVQAHKTRIFGGDEVSLGGGVGGLRSTGPPRRGGEAQRRHR